MVLFEKIILCSFVLPVCIYASDVPRCAPSVVRVYYHDPYGLVKERDLALRTLHEQLHEKIIELKAEHDVNVRKKELLRFVESVAHVKYWNQVDPATGQALCHTVLRCKCLIKDDDFWAQLKNLGIDFTIQTVHPDRYAGSTVAHVLAGLMVAVSRHQGEVFFGDNGCIEDCRTPYWNRLAWFFHHHPRLQEIANCAGQHPLGICSHLINIEKIKCRMSLLKKDKERAATNEAAVRESMHNLADVQAAKVVAARNAERQAAIDKAALFAAGKRRCA